MSEKLERLTYVEDDPDIRSIAEFALRDIGGFTVDVCGSGPEAIERSPDFNPDLIILDVMMPGMDGIETFRRLREIPKLAKTPVIFMTAKAMKHEIDRYMALGAEEVIPKPFDPLILAERIGEILQRARARKAAS
ncbi:MAG TPA: response regulator [Methyloceanibacter sp.]|nr:response regulator [Methyloceanibacter sp.]